MKPLPLKPIHLAPDPSWWPPALGWWILAVLVLAILGLLIWALVRWQLKRQKRRWLEAELQRLQDVPERAVALHRLLRRAIKPLTRDDIHTEKEWQHRLDQLAGSRTISHLLASEDTRFHPSPSCTSAAFDEARELLLLAVFSPRKARKRLEESV